MGAEVPRLTMSDHSAPTTHGGHDDHGEHDDHGTHPDHGPVLGPIDWKMWGVGVLGVICALVVVAGFVVATGFAFNA
jgi:hypothetical protein